MLLSQLTFTHLIFLLCAVIMVAAAPSLSTDKYQYKVAKRAEIINRATRTRPHYRRASPLPGQNNYAVFENRIFGGDSTTTNADTQQPSFAACASLCTSVSDCEYFRYVQTGSGNRACNLRKRPNRNTQANTSYRSAFRGITCAQAKAEFPDLASATCVEETY